MKKIILIFLFLIWEGKGFSQSILTDQFQFNFLAINPAFTGAKENFSVNLMMGNQFNGTIRPQQVHQIFSTDGTIQNGRGGLGLQAFNQNGSMTGMNISYAYRMSVGELFKVALGADGGMTYLPVQGATGSGELYPYAGLGGLLTTQRFFLSVSKPVAFMKQQGFFGKPFYSMVGFSLGDYFHSMFNFSALLQNNQTSSNNIYLTAKAWFNRRMGLGVSYRSQWVQGGRETKFLPMLEYQFSPAFRVGASYDSKPFGLFNQQNNQAGFQQRGILQLYFRYEIIRADTDEREIYRLKYY